MESSGTAICFRWCGPKCIPRTYQELIHGEWIDRNPLPVQCEFQEDGLWVSYSYQESLRIVVPWEISDLGIFFLKTVTLPKSKGPYDLVLELARGTVGRLVDQAENWKASGLVLSDTIEKQLQLVKLNFRRAAFSDGEERYQCSLAAIEASIHLMNDVGTVFAEYVFRLRKEEHQSSTALVGAPYYEVDQPELTPFADIFNLALISGTQPEIDSVPERLTRLHLQGITTCSCPLFDFRDQRRSESDTVDEIESRMISSANQQLASGLGGCKLLMPISSMGFQDAGGWNDQEQIHLVYELLSSIKGQYPRTPLVIGLDQPFGEPRVFKQRKSALQLAENLIRMQAPVAAFCLEINIGYYPEGTWIRDLFSFNDLLDSWGQFDYPLIVQFRIPGGVRTREAEDGSRLVTAGLDSQASWLEKLALLALAKHNVAGVLYAQVFDQPADPFFGAGLISSQMNEKPAMATIKNIVQQLG